MASILYFPLLFCYYRLCKPKYKPEIRQIFVGLGYTVRGVLLGISYFKYSVIIPFLFYYIYKKWYKEIILSIGMHILLTVLSAVYLSISVAEAICYPIKISMRSLEQGFIDLGQFLILPAMYLAWNRKALKVDGVFGKVFQNAALICFFISSYLIFF